MSSSSSQSPTNPDLINLSDICKIIWKRKIVFLLALFICIPTGSYFAIKKGKTYEYSFLVQLPLNGNQDSIVPMDDVRFKLKNTVVKFKKENGKEPENIHIDKVLKVINSNNNDEFYLTYKAPKVLGTDRVFYFKNFIIDTIENLTNEKVNIYVQKNKYMIKKNVNKAKEVEKQIFDFKNVSSNSPFLEAEVLLQKSRLKKEKADLEIENLNLSYLNNIKQLEIKSVIHIENDKTKLILLAGVILSLIAAFCLVLMLDSISKNKK
jgi:hypothetical protein